MASAQEHVERKPDSNKFRTIEAMKKDAYRLQKNILVTVITITITIIIIIENCQDIDKEVESTSQIYQSHLPAWLVDVTSLLIS